MTTAAECTKVLLGKGEQSIVLATRMESPAPMLKGALSVSVGHLTMVRGQLKIIIRTKNGCAVHWGLGARQSEKKERDARKPGLQTGYAIHDHSPMRDTSLRPVRRESADGLILVPLCRWSLNRCESLRTSTARLHLNSVAPSVSERSNGGTCLLDHDGA